MENNMALESNVSSSDAQKNSSSPMKKLSEHLKKKTPSKKSRRSNIPVIKAQDNYNLEQITATDK